MADDGPAVAASPFGTADLFAGVPVADLDAALAWYERFLGGPPAFRPHDAEAVWQLAEHRFVYVVLDPDHAGHARLTVFTDRLAAVAAELAARGIRPGREESYGNGVRKLTFVDPDGNEIGIGGPG